MLVEQVEDRRLLAGINEVPVADAGGPYEIQAGDTLYLDGYMSYDPDYAPSELSFAWEWTGDGITDSTEPYVDLGWVTLESIGFAQGSTRTVTLTVDDGADTAMATAEVIVAGNEIPVADAGGPYEIQAGDTLYLDGYMSYDPDYAPSELSFAWEWTGDGITDSTEPYVDLGWVTLESIGFAQGKCPLNC